MCKLKEPRVFITDYTSYIDGKQQEFGIWINLKDCIEETDFLEDIIKHFEEVDEGSPLSSGIPREKMVFTKFEGIPKELQRESMSNEEIKRLIKWANLEDYEKVSVAYMLYHKYKIDYAIDNFQELTFYYKDKSESYKHELFETYYPQFANLESPNRYINITVDYDKFIEKEFTAFDFEGETYLVHDSNQY